VYELTGHDPASVTGVSTEVYFAGKAAAPRPLRSTLDLAKLTATGFVPRDADDALRDYLGV
jgi:dTDP-4-dehydrorhamnose 3,5-epimerase